MGRPLVIVAVALCLVAGGCSDDGDREGAPSTGTTTSTGDPQTTTTEPVEQPEPEPPANEPAGGPLDLRPAALETVAGGLDTPWALAFADERTILVSERPGRVRLVRDGQLQADPILQLDVNADGEGGLLGIAVHPDFPAERWAFVYYTTSGGNRVSRFRLGSDLRFGGEEVLLDDIPSARFHDGGRIAVGPDDLLYVATGDARQPELAADRGSLAGKILRIAPDGSVPGDNPFPGSPVYSYGHRNPQGLAWDAEGNFYASEHGPTGEVGLCCHDELNLITAGGFYGWPYRAGEVAAFEGNPPQEPIPPIATSGGATWAPAGMAVHRAAGGPATLLVANLRGEQLLRLEVAGDDPRRITSSDVALSGLGRLRAAALGPDGCLYLTTSNVERDARVDERDDRLLRSCP